MNSIFVIGRLVRNPLRRKSEDGRFDFVSFQLAENVEYTKKEDNITNFYECSVDCVRNPKLGDVIMQYARQGSGAAVKGRMRMRSYEKDGVKRKLWEVIVDGFEFISSGKRDAQDGNVGDRNAPRNQAMTPIDVDPDDMPF